MKKTLAYLGVGLQALGILLVAPTLVAYYFGEPTFGFFISCITSILIGTALNHFFEREHLSIAEALVFSAIMFAAMAAFGAVPYVFAPTFSGTLVDAYFESMSGFTTTGLTLLSGYQSHPASLLFWRSFTQWIGGIGIVVMFLSILMQPGMSTFYLYRAEGKEERIWPSILRTVREQIKIYAFFTVIGISLLLFAGAPLFSSVVHTFTTVSTGGFSTYGGSISTLETMANPFFIDLILIFLMIMGSTSFALHSRILRGNFRAYLKSSESKLFYLVLLSGFLLVGWDQYIHGDPSFLKHSIFQTVSAITTTGFTNMPLSDLSDIGKYTLIVLMILGGSSGSTAGGIKMIRVALLLKTIPWYIKQILLPKDAVIPLRLGGVEFNARQALPVAVYGIMYGFLLLLGATFIMLDGFAFIDALFESASAIGTVGLSTGITTSLSMGTKIVVILEMLLGRLEIIPIFATLMMFTKLGRYVS